MYQHSLRLFALIYSTYAIEWRDQRSTTSDTNSIGYAKISSNSNWLSFIARASCGFSLNFGCFSSVEKITGKLCAIWNSIVSTNSPFFVCYLFAKTTLFFSILSRASPSLSNASKPTRNTVIVRTEIEPEIWANLMFVLFVVSAHPASPTISNDMTSTFCRS